MKKLVLLLLLLALTAAACKHGRHASVQGSGKREVQKREVGAFTTISTDGALNVEVVCQKDLTLEIEGDDNILPLIETEVSNGVLKLNSTQGYSVSQPIVVRVTVPTLEGINVNGAGRLNVTALKSAKFEIDTNGAAQIKVSGRADLVDIESNGAGSIDAHNLQALKAVVDSKGVTRIDVDVSEHLDVTISGPSTVTYQGDPAINKTIHGPGKLEKRGYEGA